MNDDINIPETDGQPGVNHTPEDADGNNIPDDAEQKAGGAKHESVREAYRAKDGFWSGVGEVVRYGKDVIAGRNTPGKVIGFGLDVFTFFAPQGSRIDRLRARGKEALNLNKDRNNMKEVFKRAFTTDGGGFIRVRDEDDKVSATAIGATIIRLLLVLGVFYAADYLGLPVNEILAVIGLG